jgi:hypothetical protein
MFDDLSLYGRYNRIIGQIGIPWWNIGGNHDLNFEAPDSRYSRETYKRVFGASADDAMCKTQGSGILCDNLDVALIVHRGRLPAILRQRDAAAARFLLH